MSAWDYYAADFAALKRAILDPRCAMNETVRTDKNFSGNDSGAAPPVIPMPPPVISTEAVVLAIADALEHRKPFSLVRVGDGESFVLGYEDTTSPDEIAMITRMWFGAHPIARHDIHRIRMLLIDACKGCDLLGVSASEEAEEKFRRIIPNLNRYNVWNGISVLCRKSVHMDMHTADLISTICKGRDFVGIVTPRPVEELMQVQWGIGTVTRWDIPEEVHYASHKHLVARHYPDRFEEIMRELTVPYPGALFFVGAGVLGKIYCHRIKQLGGVAVDIGSIFDAWAHKNSRGNTKRVRLGL